MLRASIFFGFLLALIAGVFYYTVRIGIKTGELRTRIIDPIESATEVFAEQAAKIPQSDITPIPFPTIIPQVKPDAQMIKKNIYIKAINSAYNNWAEGKDVVVVEQAKIALENATENKDKATAHYWLGLGYYRQGDMKKAELEEDAAITLDINYAAPYTTLSAISMSKGDYLLALTLAQKAEKLDPTYPWAYNNQGIALVELGRKSEGITMFKKAIQLAPDSYIFKDNLTRAENTH
jgi:tetratricopeptide (TPR) repeat protein